MRKYYLLIILAFFILSCRGKKEIKDRPNVLFIMVDDLNDWIGCMGGHPDTKTPNIDKLASEGMLFTNAHCAAPLSGPSRISLITGMHPTSTGYYMNNQEASFGKEPGGVIRLTRYFEEPIMDFVWRCYNPIRPEKLALRLLLRD